ncbi:MAG TPA: hypothetical protein VFY24_15320 [Azospira sp.]|nr:hypothetical protein [Azospira sp.]
MAMKTTPCVIPRVMPLVAVAALVLAALPGHALAACADRPFAFDESKFTLGPRHHPMGRPLPATSGFNQPDRCVDGFWFFDRNGNGVADADEVRLFGSNRQVDCGSCHGESPLAKSAASASVFLRQDAATLCLVCHNL